MGQQTTAVIGNHVCVCVCVCVCVFACGSVLCTYACEFVGRYHQTTNTFLTTHMQHHLIHTITIATINQPPPFPPPTHCAPILSVYISYILPTPPPQGCGVNVSNRHPTISLNDVIALHNKDTGSSLSPLKVEQLLALTYNRLEALLGQYETSGLGDEVEKLYYKYWLHRYTCVYNDGIEAARRDLVHCFQIISFSNVHRPYVLYKFFLTS